MFKLLIADDEKYDRDSIITILNNEFEEELEISEARNGREAIEITERVRPDIIIMDIKMPGINGLKAIQEIRKIMPNSYVIILTAYDYFDFAVEAVKCNVKEYILKPFSKQELIEKIEEAINFTKTMKKKRISEIEDQEKLYNFMSVIENELSYSIISNVLESVDYQTYLKYLNLNFDMGCALAIRIEKNEPENSLNHDKLKIGEFIKEYIVRKYKTISSIRFTSELVYFIELKSKEDNKDAEFEVINLAAEIRREVKKHYDIDVRIGIGDFSVGIDKLVNSYHDAIKALDCETDNGNIIHINNIENVSNSKKIHQEKSASEKEKNILFKSVESYINENIKNDLDLETTAAKFNLSPFYFSRVFKDVIGSNFSDYINLVRIKNAKEMLKNDTFTIKEICYSVGYSDPNYFSKVFRKYEGITPTEYKTKNH